MEIRIDFNAKTIVSLTIFFLLVVFYVKLQGIINIFAVAFFISYILIPLVHFVEKKLGISRWLSVLLIFMLFSFFVILILVIIVPFLYAEIFNLVKNVPSYFNKLLDKINELFVRYGYHLDLAQVKAFLMTKLQDHGTELLKGSVNILGNLISSISAMLGFFVVPILVFYFLKDFEFILKKGINLISQKLNIDMEYYNIQFNSILKGYFRGQLLVCLFLALMYGFLNFFVGIKGGFAIGLIAGFLSFVPYLGFIVGFVSSVLMAYLQFGDLLHPLLVVIGFIVIQFIESYFLTPKLVGEHLGLHPIAVIFALFAGGYLMGIGGMILSIPLMAFLKIVINRFLEMGTIFNRQNS